MARRGNNRRMTLNAEINVVSLIDVILLLLLIFMITAPMMTSGIELQLPAADVTPVESKDAILVEIDSRGTIFVDGKPWTLSTLRNGFKAYANSRTEVTLRSHSALTIQPFFDVVSALNAAGVTAFNLAAEPRRDPG